MRSGAGVQHRSEHRPASTSRGRLQHLCAPGPVCPSRAERAPGLAQEGKRPPPYLRGAGASGVAVIPRADGKHAHQRLLSLRTGLPGAGFLLRLPKTGPGLLSSGTFPLGCSWGFPASPLPPVSTSRLHPPGSLPSSCPLLGAWNPQHRRSRPPRRRKGTSLVNAISSLLEITCCSLPVTQVTCYMYYIPNST